MGTINRTVKISETPNGVLPLLEVDGKLIDQSFAIERYLAKMAELTIQDDFEQAQADQVNDKKADFSFIAVAGFSYFRLLDTVMTFSPYS